MSSRRERVTSSTPLFRSRTDLLDTWVIVTVLTIIWRTPTQS
jgi:hypothetical protein